MLEALMPMGKVKSFNSELGFGLIEPEDGSRQVFFHISELAAANPDAARVGQQLKYDVRQDPGKLAAINIVLG